MSRTRGGERTSKRGGDDRLPSGLTQEDLLGIYSSMVLARALDERVWMMNRQGKAAIVASAQGHEATQIGSYWAVHQHAKDSMFFPFYRSLALMVALGFTPLEVLLGFLAKRGEPLSGARQFPLHGAALERKVINISNVVATQLPHAVGFALAARMRREDLVVVTYFGDGGTSEGDCHEAMNFAGIHKLPVVFICENNKYAISVPQSKQMAVENVADRAAGYGMQGVVVDGTDILEVYRVTAEATERARKGLGPTFIEAKVERYLPHTSDDDDTQYRRKEEVQEARKRDPMIRVRKYLTERGLLTEETDKEYRDRALREVNQATDAAEAAPPPATDGFYDHVYATPGDAS